MANEEVLGPRKTMFVLVIVVGCFAVLWPRILSPLMVGHAKDKLQPNQFDRDAGCCEVLFEKNLVVLEVLNEVCSSAVHIDGKLSPYAAAECRRAVNETCGLDIAAFLKRSENIGKTSKMLIETMQSSNSSCLKEHFGVPVISLSPHLAFNSWTFQDTLKQERPPIRGAGPHPALRERGRAIPPGTPPPPSRGSHITLPPNVRVNSPLDGYFKLEIKPPPIPGMRPPLGSPGGPVPAPKSSMGFVMPIYTICIIVFFVYTVSKIFFKRATIPYEPITPDPQFRRRVFRDNSRSSPDKLVVTAISGLVAEVQQQMEASYAQNQQTQDGTDNHARPYTNGTVIHNSGPVHIIASEYREKSPEQKQPPEPKEDADQVLANEEKIEDDKLESEEIAQETEETLPDAKELSPELKSKSILEEPIDVHTQDEEKDTAQDKIDKIDHDIVGKEPKSEETIPVLSESHTETLLIDLSKPIELKKNGDVKHSIDEFIREEVRAELELEDFEDEKTKELLEEAIEEEDPDVEREKSSVKVMCMETRAASADGGTPPAPPPPPAPAPPRSHEAADVKSIFLETEIPQQSRVLVTEFAEDTRDTRPTRHAPMVVSGKMTLSLIQDAPRDTPERDGESTIDDFTTASAFTQNAEKDGVESEEEEEEIEEEVEVEEIEEEIEIDVDISDDENVIEKETENILERDAEKLIAEVEDLQNISEDKNVLIEHRQDIVDKDDRVEDYTTDFDAKDTQNFIENNEGVEQDIAGVLETDTDLIDEDTQRDLEKEIEDLLEEARNNVLTKEVVDIITKDVQGNDKQDITKEDTPELIEENIYTQDGIKEAIQNVVNVAEEAIQDVLEEDTENVEEDELDEEEKQDIAGGLETDTDLIDEDTQRDVEREIEDLLEEARNNVQKKKGGE